jgi:phenylacetate-coenzyme A ligase PaaK-like adenylate-forming protein
MMAANQPCALAISCSNQGYTKQTIDNTIVFNLSVLPKDISPEIIANFGFFSSKDRNKWDYVKQQKFHDLPVIDEALVFIHAKVIHKHELCSNTVFIAEIIDPETLEVLPEGSKGELVFTAITKEAFPILRYRTKDICVLKREKCSCGRTFIKMCKPMGRSDDMLIIRGVNVFPSQIETVLLNQGYSANYQIIVDRVRNTDTLDVHVEMTPEMFTDNMGEIDRRQREIVDGLRSMLGISAKVTLVAPKSIVRSEGKAVRIIDKRKI